jgi:hypothetical protein
VRLFGGVTEMPCTTTDTATDSPFHDAPLSRRGSLNKFAKTAGLIALLVSPLAATSCTQAPTLARSRDAQQGDPTVEATANDSKGTDPDQPVCPVPPDC